MKQKRHAKVARDQYDFGLRVEQPL